MGAAVGRLPLLAKGGDRVSDHRIAPTHPATAADGPLIPVRVDKGENLSLALGVYHKGVNRVKSKNPADTSGNLGTLGTDDTLERNHCQPLSRFFLRVAGASYSPHRLNLTEPF